MIESILATIDPALVPPAAIRWDTVALAIIAATPPTIASVAAAIVLLRRVKVVHDNTNSLVTKMVDAAEKVSHAEGVRDQKAANHDIAQGRPPPPAG